MKRSRVAGAAAVLALHGLLLLAWRAHVPPPARGSVPAERAPLVVRLLWPSAPAAAPVPAPARAAAPASTVRRATAPTASVAPAPALQAPAAAALPASADGAPPVAPAPSVAVPGPAPPALVLDLPRAASSPARLPALDDPRANSARKSVESRIAAAMARDWTEEVRPDGRTYHRRGDECIVTQPSRDAQLDPVNASQRPRQAGRC